MRATVASVGAVCNLGSTWTEIWPKMLNGAVNLVDARTVLDEIQLPVTVSAVPELVRSIRLDTTAVGAAARLAKIALEDAYHASILSSRVSLYGGSTHGESDLLVEIIRRLQGGDIPDVNSWRGIVEDSLAKNVLSTVRSGVWVNSACTSSMHALVLAMLELIDPTNGTDGVFALGVDALSVLCTTGFSKIGAATKSNCRPFSLDRDGAMVGEGAAAILLRPDSVEGAQGAVRLLGLGVSCEAGHVTRSSDGGTSLARSVRNALSEASADPSDVSAIILHGTGTASNDRNEVDAMQLIFSCNSPPATSIKGVVGHTMGAAGIFNCLVAIQACVDREIPPTLPFEYATIPGIDIVKKTSRRIGNGLVLVTCSGFGGNNCAAVFGKD